MRRLIPLSKLALAAPAAIAFLLLRAPGWAWFPEGHEVVAIIAADNLAPAARAQVARVLDVADNLQAVAEAMAAASLLPDTQFRADPRTPPWHYISLCLQDTRSNMQSRCPGGNCVTAKIDEYARRLKNQDYDQWGAAGDLAFLIHFMGDVHQPVHAASNADRGGTCQPVEVVPPEKNLHFAWDDAVVVKLEAELGTHDPRATATALEGLCPMAAVDAKPPNPEQIAWETHELARRVVYGSLGIADKPCSPAACEPGPGGRAVVMSEAYMKTAARIAGRQITKAGYRLAAMLNQIWPNGRIGGPAG